MAYIKSQGNEILIDSGDQPEGPPRPSGQLSSWVMDRVEDWRDHRDQGYRSIWAEYWRMWRGQWSSEDKNRKSERSRLIAPALSQAVEQSVAEIEEAVFSKDVWFDVASNTPMDLKSVAEQQRDMLRVDIERGGIKDAVSEACLNAAIFGTGIVKVDVTTEMRKKPKRTEMGSMEVAEEEYVCVTYEAVRPDQFVPDPAGRSINEMLGMAHEVEVPRHVVLEKIAAGVYREDALGYLGDVGTQFHSDVDYPGDPSSMSPNDTDVVKITEYHGKVPLNLLYEDSAGDDRTALDDLLESLGEEEEESADDNDDLIEAIVTIANGSTVLRAMANPFKMKDRCFVAFPWEKVPGRFWGRGVCEKGYNPQKALDAELRARIDSLAYLSAPMLGVDAGRIPRGFRMEVAPGKVWATNGPPGEVLMPLQLGQINGATFNQTQEMERMVEMGTGAFDTASVLNKASASGGQAATGQSAAMGAFVKRSKRAINNIDRNLLSPLIQKAMWRFMQFDPVRYKEDVEFRVIATLGLVAREVEAMQLTQLLGMMPEQFQNVGLTLVQGIIDNSGVANKDQIKAAIEQALQPPSEEEQQKQKQLQEMEFERLKAETEAVLLNNQKVLAEIRKLLGEAEKANRQAAVEERKVVQEDERIKLQREELGTFRDQNDIARERLEIDRMKVRQMANKASK